MFYFIFLEKEALDLMVLKVTDLGDKYQEPWQRTEK